MSRNSTQPTVLPSMQLTEGASSTTGCSLPCRPAAAAGRGGPEAAKGRAAAALPHSGRASAALHEATTGALRNALITGVIARCFCLPSVRHCRS